MGSGKVTGDWSQLRSLAAETTGALYRGGHVVAILDEVTGVETRFGNVAGKPTARLVVSYDGEHTDLARCKLEQRPGDFTPPWLRPVQNTGGHYAVFEITDVESGNVREVAATTSLEAAQAAARLLSI